MPRTTRGARRGITGEAPQIAGACGLHDAPLMDQTRRTFCVHTCQAVSLGALVVLVDACGGSPTSPSNNVPSLTTVNGTVGSGGVTVNVDGGSPLSSVGGAALVQSSAGSFLVAHTAQDTFTALTAICTHEGCTISGYESSTYTCPCHGSQFSTSGGVLRGPAGRSLQSFATTFANGTLTIRT
jgi:cytochrome b6-f complex iron-sulfur subunit